MHEDARHYEVEILPKLYQCSWQPSYTKPFVLGLCGTTSAKSLFAKQVQNWSLGSENQRWEVYVKPKEFLHDAELQLLPYVGANIVSLEETIKNVARECIRRPILKEDVNKVMRAGIFKDSGYWIKRSIGNITAGYVIITDMRLRCEVLELGQHSVLKTLRLFQNTSTCTNYDVLEHDLDNLLTDLVICRPGQRQELLREFPHYENYVFAGKIN